MSHFRANLKIVLLIYKIAFKQHIKIQDNNNFKPWPNKYSSLIVTSIADIGSKDLFQ